MMLKRLDANPLLTPADVKPTRADLKVSCTLNPAAVRFGDEILLLVRVGEAAADSPDAIAVLYFDADDDELKVRRIRRDDPALEILDGRGYFMEGKMLLSSMSHLRIARSRDGTNFTFDDAPAIFPSTPYESYGCEDARITPLDGTYYITYTAVSPLGVAVAMASTRDFKTFGRHGVIFPPYQKDVCVFPQKVRGMYVCRHRPYMNEFNDACIWTAYSPDLLSWGRHEMTVAPVRGTWQSGRVGAGAPPIRTDEGWLEIYHAADAGGVYHLGAMLSDLEHPEVVIARSREPVFGPEADYEVHGIYGNCVFSNGLIADDDGTLRVYYGAGDRVCAAAVTTVEEMIAAAKA